eukprot:m.10853 g.10853  ORF g.10853 m.10853 type:complete len:821 (+) comp4343_c0_seq1:176-2638(+)
MAGAEAITTAITLNAIIGGIILALFCILRSRKEFEWAFMPRYNPKRYVKPRQKNGWEAPPTLPEGLFAWLPFLIKVDDETIFNSCGLDALVYKLFMTLFMKLFAFMAFFGLVVLMPLYSQLGENEIEDGDGNLTEQDGIDTLSLANVEAESNVLVATFFASIMFTAYACFLLQEMYLIWIKYRYKHLIKNAENGLGLSILVQFLPEDVKDDESFARFYKSIFKEKFETSMIPRDFSKCVKLRAKIDALRWKLELAETKWEDLQQKEKENPKKKAKRPQHKTKMLCGKKVDSIDWYKEEIEKLRGQIEEEFKKEKKPLCQGFVTFNSTVATLCAEGILAPSAVPYAMEHTFAPEPRDVYWPNLKLDHKQRQIRSLLMAAATFWLVFFWIIPVAFVASLTTLSALGERIPFLEPLQDAHPILTGLLEGILPGLALILFNFLLPKILLQFAKVEGLEADSWMQVSIFKRFFIFIIVNNFLAITLAGAVFDQLDVLIEDPTSVVELLGTAVPKTATFFATFIILVGFVQIPLQLLNIAPLAIGTIMKKTLAKTPAQQDRVEAPGSILYGKDYGRHMLVMLVGFCYAPIAPIILPFAFIYFALGYITIKYRVLYYFVPTDEGGGAFWPELFQRIRVAMLVAHITLAGVLGLKEHKYITPISISIAVISWLYLGSLKKAYDVRGRYLTAEMAAKLDNGEELDLEEITNNKKKSIPGVPFGVMNKQLNKVTNKIPIVKDLAGGDDLEQGSRRGSTHSVQVAERDPYWQQLFDITNPRPDSGATTVEGMFDFVSGKDLKDQQKPESDDTTTVVKREYDEDTVVQVTAV